jgi:6-phosphofructokinase 1
VVSEGAGQEHFTAGHLGADASGNQKLGEIGLLLKDKIGKYLAERGIPYTLKYIDPSYTIRSAPADTMDAELCLLFGLFAVHAGMAGRTNMMVGLWNQHFVHVPIPLVVRERKIVDTADERWCSLLDMTGQPRMI